MRNASDAEVWSYASESRLILVSKDEEFANMVLQIPTAKLIWLRIGNCRQALLLDLFRQMWPRILERLEAGYCLIEIRCHPSHPYGLVPRSPPESAEVACAMSGATRVCGELFAAKSNTRVLRTNAP
jgi:predicted nuclease of predicted toxin-antitoxin system